MATPPFRVKAVYDYASTHEDDLGFPNGQIITVTDQEDDDWYFGEYVNTGGKKEEGLFPKNFVQPYEPETPPRPTRSTRPKKDLEPSAEADDADEADSVRPTEEPNTSKDGPFDPPSNTETQQLRKDEEGGEVAEMAPRSLPKTSSSIAPLPPVAPSVANAPSSAGSKAAPPPVAEKPLGGSFRDRINAFNKPAAAPVAPAKPSSLGSGGGSGFIKKPFVAPPPSKNAYVPPPQAVAPQKVYRREEDPDIIAQGSNDQDGGAPLASPPPLPRAPDDNIEEQPKPTSLKDRIALLQKQQMEQAARHAEKKDKPKRPPKRSDTEKPTDEQEDAEGETLDKITSNETTGKRSMDSAREARPSQTRSGTRPRKSRESTLIDTPADNPVPLPSREPFTDGNEADESGAADIEDGEDQSTGREDSDEKPRRQFTLPAQASTQPTYRQPPHTEAEAEMEDQEEDEEDEDVDPEVRRRMEIRERMAKMSGGMGMAGMFGPPGGLPSRSSTKPAPAANDQRTSSDSPIIEEESSSHAPPVPIMPMPGLANIRSADSGGPSIHSQPEVTREVSEGSASIIRGREPEDMPDVEDIGEEPEPSRRSTERAVPARPPQARPVPPPPPSVEKRGAPPPLPTERPTPAAQSNARPVPPLPNQPMSPSEGSESDDEMPSPNGASVAARRVLEDHSSRPTTREGPTAIPSKGIAPSLPSRPKGPESHPSDFEIGAIDSPTSPASPASRPDHQKRSSRIPPIPGALPSALTTPQTRAPPPPPPPTAAHSRPETSDALALPTAPPTRDSHEDEVTEYDGDYDTDIASGATHKDALKSHDRVSSLEEDSMTEAEASMHHSGLPSIGPEPTMAPRAVPPPPPTQIPPSSRQSSDMPRVAPPPVPPIREQTYEPEDGEYDPYNYTATLGSRSVSRELAPGSGSINPLRADELGSSYSTSPPVGALPPPTAEASQYSSPPTMAAPSRSLPRQSTDIQRTSTNIRRSTDSPYVSGEQGSMATDIDLAPGSQWWTVPDAPPPVFQNRRDVLFETEETSTTRRGGKQAITRTVYVLYMDYSQTVISAHYEMKNPADAALEQHHEPPPRALRQDQLEDAHNQYGTQIAAAADAKKEKTVGDGTAHTLPLDLISALPSALLPVGVRAYGALVYANLANASVQQFDEIRPGDIVTFRNAKFQGHRGPMHSKYSIEVGKPDHVGVVTEWDGTKKKVRAWEQGRESKKVRAESYKFGDMRSGEVKVWRVMPRSWVGWEGTN